MFLFSWVVLLFDANSRSGDEWSSAIKMRLEPYRMFVSLICIFVSLIYCVSTKGLFVVVFL